VAYVLLLWIDNTYDFKLDATLREKAMQFITSIQSPSSQLEKCLKLLSSQSKQTSRALKPYSSDVINTFLSRELSTLNRRNSTVNNAQRQLQFSELDPNIVADQLTLIEYNILKQIKPHEFLKQGWNKHEKEVKAPNILRYIHWFNSVSKWVSTEIVKRATPEERSVLLGKFIQVAMVSFH
jgi:hypothetical protein